jgi:NADPH:quinone reductase-like Zn-dependent oxidoreductase
MIFFVAKMNSLDLAQLADRMTSSHLTPVLDRCYALAQVPDALRYLETGRVRGKVGIVVSGPA